MPSQFDARQTISHDLLSQLVTAADTQLDDILRSIDTEITMPLRMTPSSTPDLTVSIGSIFVQNPETSRNRTIPSISNTLPNFTSGTVVFPATAGGTITVTPGTNQTLTMSSSSFLKVGLNLDAGGDLSLSFGLEGATEALATVPPAINNTFGIGYIVVETDGGGNVQAIDGSKIYQYVGGGGGSGSGDASSITTRLQDMFEDSIFAQLTAVDFAINEDDQVDVSSTGTYSLVSSTFELGNSQTLVTTNLLSPDEFTSQSKVLGKINVVVFWDEDAVDVDAVYEVSIDGFTVDVNTVTMERVGAASDTYVGSFTYNETAATSQLQLRITADAAGTGNIKGYGVFYEVNGEVVQGVKLTKAFTFLSNTDNLNTFDLGWIPDTDLLEVYHIQQGQVYKYPAFSTSGTNIVFPANSFQQDSDETVTLFAIQTKGSSFDNSDQNAALLADNHLGSEDPTLDKSVAGRGIYLRRPDGQLVELTINNSNNIDIYEIT